VGHIFRRGGRPVSRGQAAVEFVFSAALVVTVALAVLPLVVIWRERVRAERLADQVAVLAAEHRPVPPQLRGGARINVAAGEVRVTIPVDLAGRGVDVTATARLP
jgi:hypothetical protein